MEGGLQMGGGLRGWLARVLGEVVCKKVGVYEDDWQGVGERWLDKGGGLCGWLARGLGEGGLQKGGVYEVGLRK
jgi:hypothetical protein